MNESMTNEAIKMLTFAAFTVSVRVLTWTAMIGGTALFGYAVLNPQPERTLAASLFGALIFIPALWSEKRERPARQPAPQVRHYESEAA